jgi:hypothetical protein
MKNSNKKYSKKANDFLQKLKNGGMKEELPKYQVAGLASNQSANYQNGILQGFNNQLSQSATNTPGFTMDMMPKLKSATESTAVNQLPSFNVQQVPAPPSFMQKVEDSLPLIGGIAAIGLGAKELREGIQAKRRANRRQKDYQADLKERMDDIAMGEYVNTPYNAKFGGTMNYFQKAGEKKGEPLQLGQTTRTFQVTDSGSQRQLNAQEIKAIQAKKDQQVLAERKARLEKSKQAKGKPISAQQIADESGAIGDKFRIFPDDPNSIIDNYLNPAVMIGDMASGLGRVPLNIQEGNYGQAAMGIASPLAAGALAGIGAQNTGQFVNNILNPVAGVDLSGTPNYINKLSRSTDNLLGEAVGYLFRDKANKKAISEGNKWLENWFMNPTTIDKINQDLYDKSKEVYNKLKENTDVQLKYRPFYSKSIIEQFEKDKQNIEDLYSRYVNYVFTHRPNVKEYPLKNQLKEYLEVLKGDVTAKQHIHDNNYGVSYTHNQNIADKLNNHIPLHPRSGEWVSRRPEIPQNLRTSTTIHEGTHGWITHDLLKDSGQADFILNLLTPEAKEKYLTWNKLRKEGKAPEETMGGLNAYRGYMANPTEMHARIMEMRHHFGLKPEDIITPDKAKNIIDRLNKMPDNERPVDIEHLMETIGYDSSKLSDLFNRLWMAPAAVAAGEALSEDQQFKGGGMIKRADGSYSRPGLWDNIRKNRGSGRKPTKEMLEQERKIRREEKQMGGMVDSNLMFDFSQPQYMEEMQMLEGGGYKVERSNDRKGKTHKVTGPDGSVKYFGDPNMKERGQSKYGEEAFYARHKKNLEKNPHFRAYARATWQNGGRYEDNDSWLENISEIVDPTGVSSWDDVYRSYKNSGLSGETALEAFGALPLLGKVGKVGKITEEASKAFAKTQRQIRNAKTAANILNATGKYGPTLGRTTDAVQAAIGSKDNSGFQWNIGVGTPSYNGRNVLPNLSNDNTYAKGGIYIKPENKGKFTAQAQARGMGVQEFANKVMANKEDYSPTTVKRANFARNAKKFKHEMGGMTEEMERMFQMGGKKAINSVLNANKDLNWVQRLYEKDTPSIQIPGQPYPSTHFLESSDGRVYPTVVQLPNGELKYLEGNDAYNYADSTKTYIQFPTDKEAQWFSKNYKKGKGVLKGFQMGGSLEGVGQMYDQQRDYNRMRQEQFANYYNQMNQQNQFAAKSQINSGIGNIVSGIGSTAKSLVGFQEGGEYDPRLDINSSEFDADMFKGNTGKMTLDLSQGADENTQFQMLDEDYNQQTQEDSELLEFIFSEPENQEGYTGDPEVQANYSNLSSSSNVNMEFAAPEVAQSPYASFIQDIKTRESGSNYGAVNTSGGAKALYATGAYQFVPKWWWGPIKKFMGLPAEMGKDETMEAFKNDPAAQDRFMQHTIETAYVPMYRRNKKLFDQYGIGEDGAMRLLHYRGPEILDRLRTGDFEIDASEAIYNNPSIESVAGVKLR